MRFSTTPTRRTPLGNLNYNQTGTYDFTDPTTGSQYSIPRFTASQTLSPQELAIQSQGERGKLNLATLGADQSGRLGGVLNSPFDLSGAPGMGDAGMLSGIPRAATSFGDQRLLSADRARVEAVAVLAAQSAARPCPHEPGAAARRPGHPLRLDRLQRRDEGLQRPSRRATGRRHAGRRRRAAAGVSSRPPRAGSSPMQACCSNCSRRRPPTTRRTRAGNQYLTEQYALRGQPINEVTALLSGSQVSRPELHDDAAAADPDHGHRGAVQPEFQRSNSRITSSRTRTSRRCSAAYLGAAGKLGARRDHGERPAREEGHSPHRDGVCRHAAAGRRAEKKKLPIYEYSYKDDPASTRHIGPMAQDVEKIDPGRGGEDKRGVKYINASRVMGSILRAA